MLKELQVGLLICENLLNTIHCERPAMDREQYFWMPETNVLYLVISKL